jgi:hypothetical protein
MSQAVLFQHQATSPVTNQKPRWAERRKTVLKREKGPPDGTGKFSQVAVSEPVTRQIPSPRFSLLPPYEGSPGSIPKANPAPASPGHRSVSKEQPAPKPRIMTRTGLSQRHYRVDFHPRDAAQSSDPVKTKSDAVRLSEKIRLSVPHTPPARSRESVPRNATRAARERN